MMYNSTHQLQA